MWPGVDHARLVGFLRSLVGEDAEDVAQDVYVKLLEASGAAEYRGEAALETWVFAVAKRVALDHLARKRRNPVETGGYSPAIADPAPDPERQAQIAERLDRLPHTLRVAVDAHLTYGNARQAAQALGLTRSAYSHRLRRARRLLKEDW